MQARIGIIGDFNPSNPNHAATNAALGHAASALNISLSTEWIPTMKLASMASENGDCYGEGSGIFELLHRFDALFASPGSPYRSIDGALAGIRFARERGVPFAGT